MSTAAPTAAVVHRRVAWERWHAAREAELAGPYGWLSPVGFAWLTWTPQSVPGAPGQWWSDGQRAWFGAVSADAAVVDGRRTDGIVSTTVDEGESSDWVQVGQLHIEVLRRGGRLAVRLRHPESARRQAFTGVPTYPWDEAWALTADVRELPAPHEVIVETARSELRQRFRAHAVVTVSVDGGDVPLLATANGAGGLRIPFRDATSSRETAAWRTVDTAPPRDGVVEVDLNRAVNPPFAFTDHGTCPAPPGGNELRAAVTAGERAPR